MTDRIIKATLYARHKHRDQKRKYTGEEYFIHPLAVAEAVEKKGGTDDQIIAALLHDTVEDTDATIEEIQELFGTVVAELVDALTDKYTHEAYPKLNRAERKTLEADRLALISDEAKLIKLCDMIDNTLTITEYDPGFAKVYLAEKDHLYKVMGLDKLTISL